MATDSFSDIGNLSWEPTTAYQEVQSTIQSEVNQGLWANTTSPNDWCSVETSPTYGPNDSWVTINYQSASDPTQTAAVTWPAGWPPPAANTQGQLPSHFFASVAAPTSGSSSLAESGARPSSTTVAAPAAPPTYKPAGACT
jgi:hypothetical protein